MGLRNVSFTGHVPEQDKVALFSLCRGFVFPSNLRSEAFGIALLEAAMNGKPMISCEIGTGTSFVNVHQQTGFVVPPGDPVGLREAMLALRDDSELARAMGVRALHRYREYFTADSMVESYVSQYSELVSQRR